MTSTYGSHVSRPSESGKIRLLSAATVFALALWAVFIALPGAADHPTSKVIPSLVEGNPACMDIVGLEFDHDEKIEPVEDGTFGFSFNGVTGTITLEVNEGAKTFDFTISGALANAVIVKGGPNANLYDYSPLGGVSSDTDLHAPNRGGGFFGLSHISFCLIEAPPELEITKTAGDSEITVGEKASFTITVANVGQGTAENVVIDDTLPNSVLDWVEKPDTTECAITNGNTLHCDVGDLDPTDSFSVTVETTEAIQLGSSLCGTTLNNTAFTEADNHVQISDDASISVVCGAIEVDKFAKVPQSTDTQPVQGAGFTLFDGATAVDPPGEQTTDASGDACFDGLPVNTSYTLRETTTPSGYATVADQTVTSSAANADCDGNGTPTHVDVENQPLTDIYLEAVAQIGGATNSSIDCVDEGETSIGSEALSDPAELDIDGLEPGTYVCTIVIDP